MKNFYFRKDSHKYRNECKQCMNDKRGEWRKINYETAKSHNRECFQENRNY